MIYVPKFRTVHKCMGDNRKPYTKLSQALIARQVDKSTALKIRIVTRREPLVEHMICKNSWLTVRPRWPLLVLQRPTSHSLCAKTYGNIPPPQSAQRWSHLFHSLLFDLAAEDMKFKCLYHWMGDVFGNTSNRCSYAAQEARPVVLDGTPPYFNTTN